MALITSYTTLESSGIALAPAALVQTRTLVVEGGTPKYRISNYMSVPGHLPDPGVFLMQVVSAADASQDILFRVAQVPDIFAYPSIRTEAVATGTGFYRSAGAVVDYTNMTEATAAATEFKDQVNTLVKDWITYEYKFKHDAPGSTYFLPDRDLSATAQLVSAWQEAQLAESVTSGQLSAAEVAYAAAVAAYDAATEKLASLETVHDLVASLDAQSDALGSFLTRVRTAKGHLGVASFPFPGTNGSALWGALADFVLSVEAVAKVDTTGLTIDATAAGRIDATNATITALLAMKEQFVLSTGVPRLNYVEDLVFKEGGLAAGESAYVDETARVGQVAAVVSGALNDKTSARTVLDAAATAKADAARELADAESRTALALRAIYTVYPQFDPNNPNAALSA